MKKGYPYKYSDITEKVIGCGMSVHTALGNGFREKIYQRALAHEMKLKELSFLEQVRMPVYFKNEKVGYSIVDFMVEERVLVEIKAVSAVESYHLNQVLNYLKAYNLEVALLLNFGENSLNFKRLVSYKKKRRNH